MRKYLVIFAMFLFGTATYALGSTGTTPAKEKQQTLLSATLADQEQNTTLVKVGEDVPPFEVEMIDGTKIKIKDLKGKVVLINFWATWCGPCRAEMQKFPKEIVEKFAGKDFVLLAISRDETREVVEKFRTTTGYTFPMGLDPGRKIYSLFATQTIPRNFLIGKDGKIVLAEVGFTEEKLAELVAAIEAALMK